MPDYGCSDDGSDSSAAYGQALWWHITGNKVYAQNAIAILNKYAYNLKKFNNTNAPLQAAWSALKITRGAEIIRHTNAGWAEADFNAFTKVLYNVYIPLIYPGSGANGNWELSMIDAMFGIAVLTDNQTLFDHAAEFWKERVPSYLYNFNLDGTKYVPAPRGKANWYGNSVWNASDTGICQETCRDMGHTQMGINSMINAAETAYIQGLDLYSKEQERITVGLEYATRLLLNNSYPSFICNGSTIQSLTSYSATFEIAYSAYSTRLGVPLPYTYNHILKHVRPIVSQVNTLTNAYETLTHSTLAGFNSSTSTTGSTSSSATTSPSSTGSSSTTSPSSGATTDSTSSPSATGTSATNAGNESPSGAERIIPCLILIAGFLVFVV